MTKELDVRSRCMGIRRTKTGSIRTPMTFNTAEGNRAREINKKAEEAATYLGTVIWWREGNESGEDGMGMSDRINEGRLRMKEGENP